VEDLIVNLDRLTLICMIKILEKYLFVNYCGQRLGQFKGADINVALLNAISGQISPIVFIPIFFIYVELGFRSYWGVVTIFVLLLFSIRFLLRKKIVSNVLSYNLDSKFSQISKGQRRINFLLAIFLTIFSFLTFAFSLCFLSYR
jgi:hypothetical protein